MPLDSTSDVAGPMARSVEDCVRLLEVTTGVDPADNLTSLQLSQDLPGNYTQFLDPEGLQVFCLALLTTVLLLGLFLRPGFPPPFVLRL